MKGKTADALEFLAFLEPLLLKVVSGDHPKGFPEGDIEFKFSSLDELEITCCPEILGALVQCLDTDIIVSADRAGTMQETDHFDLKIRLH